MEFRGKKWTEEGVLHKEPLGEDRSLGKGGFKQWKFALQTEKGEIQ